VKRPQPAARAALVLCAVAACLVVPAARARAQQTVTIGRDNSPLLAAPGGVRLGRAVAGAGFRATGSRDGFTQLAVDGWIARSSVREEQRDGHTLAVSRAPEENLRASANGPVVARLVRGALLDEVERSGGWVHVRRAGWIAPSGGSGISAVGRHAISGRMRSARRSRISTSTTRSPQSL
jgi:hypothetical protein